MFLHLLYILKVTPAALVRCSQTVESVGHLCFQSAVSRSVRRRVKVSSLRKLQHTDAK